MSTLAATELRIGNWVQSGSYQKTDFGVLLNVELFQPIPLTPEILEKAGFELEELEQGNPSGGYYYSLRLNVEKYCDLSLINGHKNGFLEVCLFPYEDWFRYRYVHQLQNLYFALTGSELQIEL